VSRFPVFGNPITVIPSKVSFSSSRKNMRLYILSITFQWRMNAKSLMRFTRYGDKLVAIKSFIEMDDRGEGVPWWKIRKNLVMTDREYSEEQRRLRDLKSGEKDARTKIIQERRKSFVNKDQLYRALKLGKEMGLFEQEHFNGSYKVAKGGHAFTVREREIHYQRNIPLDRTQSENSSPSVSIYGLSKSQLSTKESAELDEIMNEFERAGDRLMLLQYKALVRRFSNDKNDKSTDLNILMQKNDGLFDPIQLRQAKNQLHHEINEAAFRSHRRTKNNKTLKNRIASVEKEFWIPAIAVVSPEVHADIRIDEAKAK